MWVRKGGSEWCGLREGAPLMCAHFSAVAALALAMCPACCVGWQAWLNGVSGMGACLEQCVNGCWKEFDEKVPIALTLRICA